MYNSKSKKSGTSNFTKPAKTENKTIDFSKIDQNKLEEYM